MLTTMLCCAVPSLPRCRCPNCSCCCSCSESEVTSDVLDDLLSDLAPRFRPQDYNILFHNCNTFSNELVQLLTGESLPVSRACKHRVPLFCRVSPNATVSTDNPS